VVRSAENICPLQRLGEVAEDIVDAQDALGGIGRAGDVYGGVLVQVHQVQTSRSEARQKHAEKESVREGVQVLKPPMSL
jgi:hypothetical protein